uniref:Uncharacterized protein n=1 Tax=Helianthus annuus TaxID=4232 RepID=A0A251V1S4_HELAN
MLFMINVILVVVHYIIYVDVKFYANRIFYNLFSVDVDVGDAWNLVGCLDTYIKFCTLTVLYFIIYVVFVSNLCN